MKASRLLSILLLLQTRERMTAEELARELEVSVRTVYRDVEALAASGVPVYGDAGHRGGYRLLEGYRTRLTGLSAGEAEALFLTGLPGPAAQLGLGPALAAAQLKLRAALPAALREQADRMRRRFHLDAPGWYAEHVGTPFLGEVADAVWHGREIEVRYRRWKQPFEVDRRLAPYGLVLKAGRWYLVARPAGAEAAGPRTYRVDQILALTTTRTPVDLPEDFDLAAHWRGAQADFHARLHPEEVLVRLSPRAAAQLTGAQARALEATGRPDPDHPGWTRATLPVESHAQARAQFLALPEDAEVLGPPPLRAQMQKAAHTLSTRYGTPGPRSPAPAGGRAGPDSRPSGAGGAGWGCPGRKA
ncbi:helix-turn-helix transcriptional regulator [Streptomyces antimicrobicus]|uniref:WYL domain-containing protein n=1 Tax=Streptomyces antimicrobicus TaxID=2883108 RepID=A0ABS8B612_9ACTN|nr:WYL domain-containing protein [Streptomyces antimicrobicus]MCB5180023.1 WYL domain-containing protein [Streptomyces antimicrobicus]